MTPYRKILIYIIVPIAVFVSARAWLGPVVPHRKAACTPATQPQSMPGYWTTTVFEVTAYCPGKCCCGEFADGVTASGAPVDAVSHFIAAPDYIPFGTVFRIPGYADGAPVVALDRGGAIRGLRLDCYFSTHQAALDFGRKILTVQIWRMEN